MKKKLIQIWENRKYILTGFKNYFFRDKLIELIAQHRMDICRSCKLYDISGQGCLIGGTQPCCNELLGGCGCQLKFKTRSLSSACPKAYWPAVLTQEEEDSL